MLFVSLITRVVKAQLRKKKPDKINCPCICWKSIKQISVLWTENIWTLPQMTYLSNKALSWSQRWSLSSLHDLPCLQVVTRTISRPLWRWYREFLVSEPMPCTYLFPLKPRRYLLYTGNSFERTEPRSPPRSTCFWKKKGNIFLKIQPSHTIPKVIHIFNQFGIHVIHFHKFNIGFDFPVKYQFIY